jgi:hypothetical protein
MPFVAQCLFCETKVRVPDESEGMSLDCPRCGNSFTVAPMRVQPEVTAAKLRPPPAAATAAATVLAGVRQQEENRDPAAPPPVIAPPEEWRRPWLFPYELIGGVGLLCAGLGAGAAPLPGWQKIAAGLGGAGLVLGLIGCVVAKKPDRGGWLRPAAAVVIGAVVVVLALVWPDFLGGGPPLGDNTPRPFGRDVPPVEATPPAMSPEATKTSIGVFALGTTRITITSVYTAPIKVAGGTTAERGLYVALRIANDSHDTVKYRSWSWPLPGDKSPGATLKDIHDKSYKLRTIQPGREVTGQVGEATLRPQSDVDDLLIFEAPASAITTMRLDLPLTSVGGTGTAHFVIPGLAVTTR